MGECIRDHSSEDILEKIEEIEEFLAEGLNVRIIQGLKDLRWDQKTLNEIFHALKKLEKKISEDERAEVLLWLENV